MSHQFKNAWNLTTDVATIVAKAGGYNSVAHYEYESDVIHQIHLIKKPFTLIDFSFELLCVFKFF